MDISCTSQIKLIIKHDSFLIQWQKTHYGHKRELQHIRISQEHRQVIASKLISGVTPVK
jgi:hypothetical protein